MHPTKPDPLLAMLSMLSLFFISHPYISIFHSQSDLQPLALVFCVAFLGIVLLKSFFSGNSIFIPKSSLLLLGVFLYSVFISFYWGGVDIRSLGGYFSIFAFSYAGYYMAKNGWLSVYLFATSIFAWLIVGMLQKFVSPTFATSLIRVARTTTDRGVVSLAPEPSYFGVQCLFFLFLIYFLKDQIGKRHLFNVLLFMLVFQIVFLSQSMMAISGLAIFFVVRLALEKRWIIALSACLALFILFSMEQSFSSGHRLSKLINYFIHDPLLLISHDGSGNQRAADIFVSLFSFYDRFPFSFGKGTGMWNAYFSSTIRDFHELFWNPRVGATRIMSGYGGAIFELGYVGCLIPFCYFRSLSQHKSKIALAIAFSTTIYMFTAVPLAFPLFGFIMGVSEGIYSLKLTAATDLATPDESKMSDNCHQF